MTPAHTKLMQEIQKRVSNGERLEDAINGVNAKLPHSTNYPQLTSRKTGQRPKRDDIGSYYNRSSFESPPEKLDEFEERTKDKYWDDIDAQRVLRILCKDTNPMVSDDIVEAYNDLYTNDERRFSKTKAVKILLKLNSDSLAHHETSDGKRWWSVDHPERTEKLFINRESETPIRKQASKRRKKGSPTQKVNEKQSFHPCP